MRRVWKRIAITAAGLAGAAGLTAGVLAWRATRVPAWYAAARDIAPDSPAADDALNRRLIPLQNWLARTTAGDLDAKPESEKEASLTLTETQINALLAKGLDRAPGRFVGYRVRLTPGRIDVACEYPDWGRTVGAGVTVVDPILDADATPAVRLDGVYVGDQGVPAGWATAAPARQLRALLGDAPPAKPYKLDEHGLAGPRTVGVYYGRLMLDVLAGKPVRPLAFLPGSPGGDDLVATKITRLDVAEGTVTVAFRILGPAERTAVVAELDRPLPK